MTKIVIIGMDGATWDLLKPWADEGKLPVLKNLIEKK
jgi:predicted AlkP superfamily phosphohydrolase/phosphomutase